MQFPDLYELTLPALVAVGDGADWSAARLTQHVAAHLGLTEQQQRARRSDDRLVYFNRLMRAVMCLAKAGLVEFPAPRTIRVTQSGTRLLTSAPSRLGWDFFRLTDPHVEPTAAATSETAGDQSAAPVCLEDELRGLCGNAVIDDRAWDAVRRINGWGPEPPCTYRRVANEMGTSVEDLLALGRQCKAAQHKPATLLCAALSMATSRADLDPDSLALDLAFAGITAGFFTLPGLAEAARRFGRWNEWEQLLRYFESKREYGQRPRPFESWFELEVYLCLVDLGYAVRAQQKIGRYRVDMLLPEFMSQVVVECDGDRYHGEERRRQDEERERWLCDHGYRILRFRYSDFTKKPAAIKRGLAEELAKLQEPWRQTRLRDVG